MLPTASDSPQPTHKAFTRRQSILLVFICTLFGAAAQVFMKLGGARVDPAHFQVLAILMDWPLLAGYVLYGLNTLMLMFALRDGELSMLYPVIALTFVWVNILSVLYFHEHLGVFKIAGIAFIMAGVTVLGRATPK